jgi:hypothetical protein
MDASIQSQGCECSQYDDSKSYTGELLKLPSMALGSSIHAGMTIIDFLLKIQKVHHDYEKIINTRTGNH